MKRLLTKHKPANGFSHFIHLALTVLLPTLVFVFVRINFVQIALVLIILSKWRMFAIRPRHWPANIRANAVDITVGISFLIFMVNSGTQAWQLVWAVAYGIWLLFIKPSSSTFMVSMQAMLAQTLGLMALFLHFNDAPTLVLVLFTWTICYSAARHFFTNFDEPLTSLLAYTWGYFAAALVWLLAHWLLFYGLLAQPTLLLTVLAFGLGGLYYLDQTDKLSVFIKRNFVFIMVAIIVIVIAFSDWGDKAI
jgi:hypothetical protein